MVPLGWLDRCIYPSSTEILAIRRLFQLPHESGTPTPELEDILVQIDGQGRLIASSPQGPKARFNQQQQQETGTNC